MELSQASRLKEVDWRIHFSITAGISKNGSCCLTCIWVIWLTYILWTLTLILVSSIQGETIEWLELPYRKKCLQEEILADQSIRQIWLNLAGFILRSHETNNRKLFWQVTKKNQFWRIAKIPIFFVKLFWWNQYLWQEDFTNRWIEVHSNFASFLSELIRVWS